MQLLIRFSWKNFLRRLVVVMKHLCQRGLPLFGSDETLHSQQNGNFMGSLEIISVFDPFLSDHLAKYANIGSGRINYLSSRIVELMCSKIHSIIKSEVVAAKYFGGIVDSTPDVSHVDQLTVFVLYVNKKGEPVERFLIETLSPKIFIVSKFICYQ